ncbi:MAG: NUDIX hydrolase [bacterium]|nr:NUDIX hydrolase [bacterium]
MNENPVSVVVFYDISHKLLMHKRKSSPEKWAFIGGGIKTKEDPLVAAKREVQEELGYEAKNLRFFRKYEVSRAGDISAVYVYIAPFPGFDQFHHTKEGDIRSDLHLVTIEQAKTLPSFPVAYQIMEDVVNFLNRA